MREDKETFQAHAPKNSFIIPQLLFPSTKGSENQICFFIIT